MTHDRVDRDEFFLTQEYLATYSASSGRPVSVAAGDLQRQGLIKYSRGQVSILEREGLESASCECFERIRSEFASRASELTAPPG